MQQQFTIEFTRRFLANFAALELTHGAVLRANPTTLASALYAELRTTAITQYSTDTNGVAGYAIANIICGKQPDKNNYFSLTKQQKRRFLAVAEQRQILLNTDNNILNIIFTGALVKPEAKPEAKP
jgi:hypothetical protein